jgi:hypothetical protein
MSTEICIGMNAQLAQHITLPLVNARALCGFCLVLIQVNKGFSFCIFISLGAWSLVHLLMLPSCIYLFAQSSKVQREPSSWGSGLARGRSHACSIIEYPTVSSRNFDGEWLFFLAGRGVLCSRAYHPLWAGPWHSRAQSDTWNAVLSIYFLLIFFILMYFDGLGIAQARGRGHCALDLQIVLK